MRVDQTEPDETIAGSCSLAVITTGLMGESRPNTNTPTALGTNRIIMIISKFCSVLSTFIARKRLTCWILSATI